MSTLVLVCGNVFDGLSDALAGPAEILIEGNRITKIERSVGRPIGRVGDRSLGADGLPRFHRHSCPSYDGRC
jgi:hypothetical protein